jgi:hypothetical protein
MSKNKVLHIVVRYEAVSKIHPGDLEMSIHEALSDFEEFKGVRPNPLLKNQKREISGGYWQIKDAA